MAYLIPEHITRLRATAFVSDAEMSARGGCEILGTEAQRLAETALKKLITDCISIRGDDKGPHGNVMTLDVYVLSPSELHAVLAEARKQGERDTLMWGSSL